MHEIRSWAAACLAAAAVAVVVGDALVLTRAPEPAAASVAVQAPACSLDRSCLDPGTNPGVTRPRNG